MALPEPPEKNKHFLRSQCCRIGFEACVTNRGKLTLRCAGCGKLVSTIDVAVIYDKGQHLLAELWIDYTSEDIKRMKESVKKTADILKISMEELLSGIQEFGKTI